MATTLTTSATALKVPALQIAKFSLGMGDRFAHEAEPQLRACELALEAGVRITPVWNKSNREHTIIGSRPESVRAAAEAAIKKSGWKGAFHIDADHVNVHTVDNFLAASDFFTIDVADAIGKAVSQTDTVAFIQRHPELLHPIDLVGASAPLVISGRAAEAAVHKFLFAVREAGKTYRHILQKKGDTPFITEVSMDETDSPQTPAELLVILAALADEGVPIQTIAPKFTGRFNKGVDYVGDVAKFEAEFRADIAVIARAIEMYGLPANLKLSLHSGSDKFSIYAPIARALRDFDAGIHVKTAGTTWLEELIGLAEAGGEGLDLAKQIYAEAFAHREELCVPYATVIDVDPAKLPAPADVAKWSSEQYTSALRHDPKSPHYNRSLRQLLHVGFKVAAKMGDRYLRLLEQCRGPIARNVTTNLFERHVRPIFLQQ